MDIVQNILAALAGLVVAAFTATKLIHILGIPEAFQSWVTFGVGGVAFLAIFIALVFPANGELPEADRPSTTKTE